MQREPEPGSPIHLGDRVLITCDPDGLGVLGKTGTLVRWAENERPFGRETGAVIQFESGIELFIRLDCLVHAVG